MPIGKALGVRVILVAVLCAAVLTGCGSKKDPNKKNFGAAISQYLDKKGDLCLGLSKWPVDVTDADVRQEKFLPGGTAAKMNALAAAALVSGAEGENVEKMPGLGGIEPNTYKYKVKRYVLTDAGKKYYREEEVEKFNVIGGATTKVKQGDVCYGKMALDKVVKWEGPMKLGEYQEASVRYLYRIDGLPDWTKNPQVRAAFPIMAQMIDAAGKKEQTHGVKLTSEGWEPLGLDR